MTAPATPVADPVSGQVAIGTDVSIDPVVDVTFYYTLDGTTPDHTCAVYSAGAFDDLLDVAGDNLNIKVVAYNDSDTTFAEPSDVLYARYSAVGYGAAVGANTPAVVDTQAVQIGGSIEGMGMVGADNTSIGGSRIGGAPGSYFKYETNV